MTRRERLERRAERRREWAESRERKAEEARKRSDAATEGIPFGQPILQGHHSERRHRKALERSRRAASQASEHAEMADRHERKARGIERQLERSVFSDDEDAGERLRERIEEREALRERLKAVNAAWRKAGEPTPDDREGWERIAEDLGSDIGNLDEIRLQMARDPMDRSPCPPYRLRNLGAKIRRDRKRLEELEAST